MMYKTKQVTYLEDEKPVTIEIRAFRKVSRTRFVATDMDGFEIDLAKCIIVKKPAPFQETELKIKTTYTYQVAYFKKDGSLTSRKVNVKAEDLSEADRIIDERWSHKAYDIELLNG